MMSPIMPDSRSPAVADVWLVDLDFPADSSQVGGARTKADGSFSLTGIERRHYAVFAHFEMGGQHSYSAVLEMRRMTGKPIRLELPGATPSQDCTICRRFKLREMASVCCCADPGCGPSLLVCKCHAIFPRK